MKQTVQFVCTAALQRKQCHCSAQFSSQSNIVSAFGSIMLNNKRPQASPSWQWRWT